MEYLQRYSFVLKNKFGIENKAADALSRQVTVLSIVSTKVTRFEKLRDEYESCLDFGEIYNALSTEHRSIVNDHILRDGYLFKANKLCIPRSSMRDFLVWEVHVGGLSRHFGRNKTIEEVERQFFGPSFKRDVAKTTGQMSQMSIGQAL